MQSRRWQGWAPTALLEGFVSGRRLGHSRGWGRGRIGKAVRARCRSSGLQVHSQRRACAPDRRELGGGTYMGKP